MRATHLRSVMIFAATLCLWTITPASAQQNYLVGKVAGVSRQGIVLDATEGAAAGAGPVPIAAGAQTQVRINVLASPDRIIPGTYVEMRVLWDGENQLRATSIKLPEGPPSMFGLYEG